MGQGQHPIEWDRGCRGSCGATHPLASMRGLPCPEMCLRQQELTKSSRLGRCLRRCCRRCWSSDCRDSGRESGMWGKGRRHSPSPRAESSHRLTSNSWDAADADTGCNSWDAANAGQDPGSCRGEQHGQRGHGDTASIPRAGREGAGTGSSSLLGRWVVFVPQRATHQVLLLPLPLLPVLLPLRRHTGTEPPRSWDHSNLSSPTPQGTWGPGTPASIRPPPLWEVLLPYGLSLQAADSRAGPSTRPGPARGQGASSPAMPVPLPWGCGVQCTCPGGVSCLSCQEAGSYPAGPEACNHNTAVEPSQAPPRGRTTGQTEQPPWISCPQHHSMRGDAKASSSPLEIPVQTSLPEAGVSQDISYELTTPSNARRVEFPA